ncbi:MAG: hypothetical protein U0903_01065 [Planctomycetales bacterium]
MKNTLESAIARLIELDRRNVLSRMELLMFLYDLAWDPASSNTWTI